MDAARQPLQWTSQPLAAVGTYFAIAGPDPPLSIGDRAETLERLTYEADVPAIRRHSFASADANNLMNLTNTTDESLLAIYESVRRQVMADVRLGNRRLAGNAMKQYANQLQDEMNRRQISFTPIEWPASDRAR
jgi:hypothetical protein